MRVGKRGSTENVLTEVDGSLAAHELIKVKLSGDREGRAIQAQVIADACDATIAGIVGKIAILYRQNPDPEKRQIDLS